MKIIKYLNVLILLILIILVLKFDSFKSISTELSTILPNSDKKEFLQEFNKLQSTKKVFLLVEGLDKDSFIKIKELEKKLVNIQGLSIENFKSNKDLEEFKQKYALFINEFKQPDLEKINIKEELLNIKEELLNSDFAYFIDKKDPLNLFVKENQKNSFSLKNNHLIIKDFAYFSIFNIDKSINSLQEFENTYDLIQNIVVSNKEVKVFSPIFYFVENSRIIKSDINKIIIFSTIVLLLLYLIILRNTKLLINSLITLASSILLALLINSFIFTNLSIFVLVFGVSISTVAIDYMFHHLVHNHYNSRKNFNKEVFLGMITSVGAFFIISFISFDLLKQICYFAIISLLFSYLQFAFLYPLMGFSKEKSNYSIKLKYFSKVQARYIVLFSIFIIITAFSQIKLDSNLKNLDVDNIDLKAIENSFNEKLNIYQNIPVLIKANSIDELIKNSKILKKAYPKAKIPLSVLVYKKEFEEKISFLENKKFYELKNNLKKEAINQGFKEDFFDSSYKYNILAPSYSMELLKNFGFEIILFKDHYISYVHLPKDKAHEFSKYDFVQSLSIKKLFEQNLLSIYNELLFYGSISILFIVLMVLISTRRNYLTSFSYILFPLSMILALSFFIEFNILHIFMIFILLSISIDFGIYMASKNRDNNSYKAVVYSLLSTFAGFGVLIFSEINALFSIGIIATIGILAITTLLILLKRPIL